RDRTGADDRGLSARRDRCRVARSGARRGERSSARPRRALYQTRCATIAEMHRSSWCALLAVYVAAASAAVAAQSGNMSLAASIRDPIERARALYNERRFDAAIAAADQARATPARAGSGDLIAARAYLERFRASA